MACYVHARTELLLLERSHDPEVARQILRYFLAHPGAADDLEGIARWRLLEQTVHESVEDTAKALDWLVTAGFLQRRRRHTKASGPIFALDEAMRDRVGRFLGEKRT